MERNDFDEDKPNVEHRTLRLQILNLTGKKLVLIHSTGTKDLIRMDIAVGRWRLTCNHEKIWVIIFLLDVRFSLRFRRCARIPRISRFLLLANDVQSLRQSPSRVTGSSSQDVQPTSLNH